MDRNATVEDKFFGFNPTAKDIAVTFIIISNDNNSFSYRGSEVDIINFEIQPTLPTSLKPEYLKCPKCNFQKIHPDTIEDHIRLTHVESETTADITKGGDIK